MKEAVDAMRDVVFSHMRKQEEAGNLSKAHSYDHVANVSRYAGVLAPFFARQFGAKNPERLAVFARMAGLSHDVIRYASEAESGEDASAAFLQGEYDAKFSSLVPRDYFEKFVVDVVRNSGESFPKMSEIYQDDPEARAVAFAVTAGDKLVEASGPRVLERRSFFVGKERMKSPKDLGAVFSFPDESYQGVLTETMVRLGSVNHVSNYAEIPPLLTLAQELHSPQYHWYAGLLKNLGIGEEEALEYLLSRLRSSESTGKLANRLERGGRRLVEEEHLEGSYFRENGLDVLYNAVENVPEDAEESSLLIVKQFVDAESPEEATEDFRRNPKGPPTFQRWMRDIIAYKEGDFGEQLVKRLEG